MKSADAFKAVLPTSRHAEMLLDLVVSTLGPMCVVETAGGGTLVRVSAKDKDYPDWTVPWPMLELSRGRRLGYIMGGEGEPSDEAPPARDEEQPRLRGLAPGELEIFDGAHAVTLTYGQDGRLAETTRKGPEDLLSSAIKAVERGGAQPIELLAEHLANMDIGSACPGRILYSVGCGRPALGVWFCALDAFKDAMIATPMESESTWVAVDGNAGTVLRSDPERSDAIRKCEEGISKFHPRIPELKPRFTQEELAELGFDGLIQISAPATDAPSHRQIPAITPIGITKLDALPSKPPPFGNWMRLLNQQGRSIIATMMREGAGLLIVTEAALRRVPSLETLTRMMDDADHRYDAMMPRPDWEPPRPRLRSDARNYSFKDSDDDAPKFYVTGGSLSHEFSGRVIRSERVDGGAFRKRRID
jgi:hypothetical protein